MSSVNAKEDVLVKVNTDKLCREETYTDTEVCFFRQLIPIHPDGSPDPSREPIFMGQTHVVSEAGPVPVQAHLEAKTLEEAILEFPEAAKQALDKLVNQAKESQRRREAAGSQAQPSKIVRP